MTTEGSSRIRGRFQELARDECMDLLNAKTVGRIAFCAPSGPVVLPVNYVVQDETVVFRTSAHNSLAANLRDSAAAFEVDELDDYLEAGWSVLIKGRASFVEDTDELPGPREGRPEPWAEGVRTLFIRVTPHEVTGRRVLPG